jgi:hypothetical protein
MSMKWHIDQGIWGRYLAWPHDLRRVRCPGYMTTPVQVACSEGFVTDHFGQASFGKMGKLLEYFFDFARIVRVCPEGFVLNLSDF